MTCDCLRGIGKTKSSPSVYIKLLCLFWWLTISIILSSFHLGIKMNPKWQFLKLCKKLRNSQGGRFKLLTPLVWLQFSLSLPLPSSLLPLSPPIFLSFHASPFSFILLLFLSLEIIRTHGNCLSPQVSEPKASGILNKARWAKESKEHQDNFNQPTIPTK